MSKTIIEREKRKMIIRKSYYLFRIKERENKTKSATIADIIKVIKKELKEDAN